jgi:CHASE2 domain-containing sensor protein
MLILRPNRDPIIKQLDPRHSRRFYITLILLVTATSQLYRVPFFHRLSGFTLDSILSSLALQSPQSTKLVVVRYSTIQKHFSRTVPLPAANLFAAIQALDRYRPAVIAVDVITDGDDYRKLQPPRTNATLIWARAMDRETLDLGKVLGRDEGLIPARFGISVFALDSPTEPIRSFRAFFDQESTLESFPIAIVSEFCKKKPDDTRCGQALATRGSKERILQIFDDSSARPLDLFMGDTPALSPKTDEYVDKVLILGGDYGNDVWQTPLGSSTGARLVMSAVESILSDPKESAPGWTEILIKLVVGLVVGLVHRNFAPTPAAILTIVLTCGIAWAGALLLENVGYWVNMAIIVIGIWIEQLYETVELAQHELSNQH